MAIRNCFEPEHSIMDTSFLRAMCDNIRDSGYFKIQETKPSSLNCQVKLSNNYSF